MTASSELRAQGNALYSKLSTAGLAPVLFRSRARQAIVLYKRALATAKTDEEAGLMSQKHECLPSESGTRQRAAPGGRTSQLQGLQYKPHLRFGS